MFAAAIRNVDWRRLTPTPREMNLMVAAGATWGIVFTAGMAALKWWNCAMICPDEIVATAVLSIATGIIALGPLAVFGRRRPNLAE